MRSRTYNILAAGKPILALTEDGSELARVIDEERVGWYVRPGNAEKLKEVVLRCYDERSDLPKMRERARKAALEKYSLQTAVDSYRRAMR